MKNEKANEELKERLLDFAVNILNMLSKLPYKKEYEVIRFQLSRSATSIGANYEESQSSTYREFLQKVRIALRESNETKYWLNIIKKLKITETNYINLLIKEISEITNILGAIASKADKKIRTANN